MQRRPFVRHLLIFVLGMMLLAACTGDGNEFLGMPLTQATPIPTNTPIPTVGVMTPEPEEEFTPEVSPDEPMNTILLWVPPFMDPTNGTQAGALFQERLDAFVEQTPNVEIIIRVKAEKGTASLIESLTAVSAVSPLELPSLIILDRNDLESAAKKGLILPMGDYSTIINEIGWFQYARSLSVIGDSSFGLPLIGEALVMVVREEPSTEGSNEPTPDSTAAIAQVAFWKNDPEASLLLNDYMAAGGQFVDEENQIVLSLPELTSVYAKINSNQEDGMIYTGVSEITSYADAWELFKTGVVDMVIVPSSYPLEEMPENSRIVPMPSIADFDHTLANGWTVALADPLPERRELAVALAESLTEVTFMGKWSEALNSLPVRGEAFESWTAENQAQSLSVISLSARIYPSQEIIDVVSPALQAGLAAVLDQRLSPEEAAQIAIDALTVEE